MLAIALLTTVLAGGPGPSPKETLYLRSCETGVKSSLEVLPNLGGEEEMRLRGLASCRGSLIRLRKSGELEREPAVVTFGCGYAVGAMFAKFGLQGEVIKPPFSARAMTAIHACERKMPTKRAP
jgi:hypothetical protein